MACGAHGAVWSAAGAMASAAILTSPAIRPFVTAVALCASTVESVVARTAPDATERTGMARRSWRHAIGW